MAHWLLKSEPFKYSWDQMVKDGRTHWDGVRNHQAALNLKAMKVGDTAFFYHSNEGKEIVGIVEIVKEAYPDPSDPAGRFVMVDVAPIKPALADLALIRQSRLSVVPICDAHWGKILAMAAA
jgi:predicted RNA-binding protein with PUA-like domain